VGGVMGNAPVEWLGGGTRSFLGSEPALGVVSST